MAILRTEGEVQANPYTSPTAGEPGAVQPAGPTPRKLAGKFDNEQELEKGYENQQTVLTERTNDLANANATIRELQTMMARVADRMSPEVRTVQRSRAREVLEASGIPFDALAEAINEQVASTAPKLVENVLAPITQGAHAQQTVGDEFPDISLNDVQAFLRANPAVNRKFQEKNNSGKPAEALYFAFGQYALHQAAQDQSGQAEARERERNRQNANLPGSKAPDTRGEPSYEQNLAQAYDKYLNTGEKTSFLLERLSHIPGVKPTQR